MDHNHHWVGRDYINKIDLFSSDSGFNDFFSNSYHTVAALTNGLIDATMRILAIEFISISFYKRSFREYLQGITAALRSAIEQSSWHCFWRGRSHRKCRKGNGAEEFQKFHLLIVQAFDFCSWSFVKKKGKIFLFMMHDFASHYRTTWQKLFCDFFPKKISFKFFDLIINIHMNYCDQDIVKTPISRTEPVMLNRTKKRCQ